MSVLKLKLNFIYYKAGIVIHTSVRKFLILTLGLVGLAQLLLRYKQVNSKSLILIFTSKWYQTPVFLTDKFTYSPKQDSSTDWLLL